MAATPPLAVAPFDDEQAKKHQETWATHLGVPVEFTNSIGMKFRLVPPGRFQMGSPDTEEGREPQWEPQHEVTISRPFYLCTTEVTQKWWTDVVDEHPSDHRGDPDLPVEHVSWEDCANFIEQLNALNSDQNRRYRFPTEAEWEYACRAGTQTRHCGGDDPLEAEKYAWCKENTTTTRPVGTRLPNAWGICDMHGNVWEYCSDRNQAHLSGDYGSTPAVDPTGPAIGDRRMLRGSFFGYGGAAVRSAFRGSADQCGETEGIGLRVVCEIPVNGGVETSGAAKATPTFNGHRYQLIKTPMTWHQAIEHCRSLGGNLCCLETEEEREFVTKMIVAGGEHAWLGGTDVYTDGEWRWITGTPIETRADDGLPADLGQNASLIYADGFASGRLAAFPSGRRRVFVCEWGGTPLPECPWSQSNRCPNITEIVARESRKPRVTFGDHSYLLVTSELHWYEAKRVCEAMGGYLCCVESNDEDDRLHAFVCEWDALSSTSESKPSTVPPLSIEKSRPNMPAKPEIELEPAQPLSVQPKSPEQLFAEVWEIALEMKGAGLKDGQKPPPLLQGLIQEIGKTFSHAATADLKWRVTKTDKAVLQITLTGKQDENGFNVITMAGNLACRDGVAEPVTVWTHQLDLTKSHPTNPAPNLARVWHDDIAGFFANLTQDFRNATADVR